MITLRKYFLLSLLVISCSSPIFADRTGQNMKQVLWGAATNGLVIGVASAYSTNNQMNLGALTAATLLTSFAVTNLVRNFDEKQVAANRNISLTESFICNLSGAVVGGPVLAGFLARKYAATPIDVLSNRW